MSRTISDIKVALHHAKNAYNDPRVQDLVRQIVEERKSEIEALQKELEELRQKIKGKNKPRWPEDTPEHVVEFCKDYWRGSTEYHTFRIHCWNDKAVWTSWPSGGYSDNGGWHPTSACFFLIPFGSASTCRLIAKELKGRVSLKQMKEELENWTKSEKE